MEDIKVSVVKYPDCKYLMLRYLDPLTGRQKTKSAKTTNKREAEKAAGKWEAELREGRYQSPRKTTWEGFHARYEVECLPTLTTRTAEPRAAVLNHVENILNPSRLADLTAERLSIFQVKLREEKLKDTTITGHLAHLKAILGWAKRIGLMPVVPPVTMPRRAKGQTFMRGRPITTEEFERMILACEKVQPDNPEPWRRYLTGLWLSGLRLEESLKLGWEFDAELGIDLSGRRPRLRIYAEHEKGNQDRLLPLTPAFAEWLLATPEADRQGTVFKLGLSAKNVSRVVSGIGKAAAVVVNKAEGKFASAHDLRRAFGTRWSSRVKPATLQLLMRHADISTTLKYYVAQNADEIGDELWASHEAQKGNTSGNTQPRDAEAARDKEAARHDVETT